MFYGTLFIVINRNFIHNIQNFITLAIIVETTFVNIRLSICVNNLYVYGV